MSNLYANKPPTERETGGGFMGVAACQVRGQLRWKVETFIAGKRKRQFFKDRASADKAMSAALKHRADLGRAFEVLSARERAQIMTILSEIEQAGLTLAGVWKTVQTLPNSPQARCTLGKAITETVAAKVEGGCRPKYIKQLTWYLGSFAKGREETDVRQIGAAHIEAWFSGRNEAPRSRKGHVSLLSTLFDHCWRRRYISENPVKRLDKVYMDRGIPRVLELGQCWRAMVWTCRRQPEVLAWLTLALFCGMRPDAEADQISWGDIDLDRGRIVITKSKVRTPRIIDLEFCPPALPWLRVAKAIGGRLPLPKTTRIRGVRKLRAFLGMDRWPQDVLRHTAASNLLAFHQDAGKIAAFLGHSAGPLLRDYKALVFKEDAERFMGLLPKQRHFQTRKLDQP